MERSRRNARKERTIRVASAIMKLNIVGTIARAGNTVCLELLMFIDV